MRLFGPCRRTDCWSNRVHASIDVTLGTAGAVAYAAHVRGERIEDVAERCVVNGLRFLSSLGSMTTTSSS